MASKSLHHVAKFCADANSPRHVPLFRKIWCPWNKNIRKGEGTLCIKIVAQCGADVGGEMITNALFGAVRIFHARPISLLFSLHCKACSMQTFNIQNPKKTDNKVWHQRANQLLMHANLIRGKKLSLFTLLSLYLNNATIHVFKWVWNNFDT